MSTKYVNLSAARRLFSGKKSVLVPDRHLRTLAAVQLSSEMPADPVAVDGFFCSQLVIAAFTAAGAPIFSGKAQWISPTDLLPVRNGDVASYQIPQQLSDVDHFKRWDLKTILGFRNLRDNQAPGTALIHGAD